MDVDKSRLDARLELLGAWSGFGWLIFSVAGFVTAKIIPPRSPATSASDLANLISDHKYQVLIGMALILFGSYTFLLTWSLTLAHQIRKYANSSRLASYVLVAVGINGALIGMLCGVVGSAMAFRVGSLSPATVQVMYDIILFLFLIPWPPFLLWQCITGFAILSTTNKEVMFPRWLGYFSLWAGALEFFSVFSVFYYRGPFSYNGLVSFYVPGASFFVWVVVLAIFQIRRWPVVNGGLPSTGAEARSNADAPRAKLNELPQSAKV